MNRVDEILTDLETYQWRLLEIGQCKYTWYFSLLILQSLNLSFEDKLLRLQ